MDENVKVERVISAPADTVWAMVADVTRMREWSPENVGCEWIVEQQGPVVGARFRGTNRNGKKTWKTVSKVVDAQPAQSFAFDVSATGFRVARWEYRFETQAAGECRVTETFIDQRGKIVHWLGGVISGVPERLEHNRAGMEATLARLAAAAESSAT